LNITPLLDLAFVLLVIFIITTTPVVNDLDVDLPSAAPRAKEPKPKVNYVTVEKDGSLYLNKDRVEALGLQAKVAAMRMENFQRNETQDINIIIRGSAKTKYQNIVSVMDALQQANVAKVNLATEALGESPAKKE
jgi:biopolymer transport protein ExbD